MEKLTIKMFEENGILDVEKIINTYNSYIYKILSQHILNQEDIEEILSDVFLIFWKNYKKIDYNTDVKDYLAGITKNLIKKKYRDSLFAFENIELYEDSIFDDIDIEKAVENREKSKIIAETLNYAKSEDREIFNLYYYYQKKVKEIAQTFNMSESKVKIILYRVRKQIKKKLRERGYSYGK